MPIAHHAAHWQHRVLNVGFNPSITCNTASNFNLRLNHSLACLLSLTLSYSRTHKECVLVVLIKWLLIKGDFVVIKLSVTLRLITVAFGLVMRVLLWGAVRLRLLLCLLFGRRNRTNPVTCFAVDVPNLNLEWRQVCQQTVHR